MTLKTDLQQMAYDLTFNDPEGLSSVAAKGKLLRITLGDWQPDGTIAETTSSTNITGFFLDYTVAELTTTKNIASGDIKLILAAKNIKTAPKETDQIDYRGSLYNVIMVEKDAADATYTLQLRLSQKVV